MGLGALCLKLKMFTPCESQFMFAGGKILRDQHGAGLWLPK